MSVTDKGSAQGSSEAEARLIAAIRERDEALRTAATVRAEAAAARQALDAVLSGINDGLMAVDRTWRVTCVNDQAAAVNGMTPEAMVGRNIWDLFPEAVGTLFHRKAHLVAGKGCAAAFECFSPSTRRWLEYRMFPCADGIMILEHDITLRKEAERKQRLLTAELQHRVRNNLALIRSLSTRTLRRAASLEDFAETFEGRLHALAVAQTLLSHSGIEQVDLHELLTEELLPYDAREGDDLRVHGPTVLLRPKTAQLLGLVFHELATNAVRHGALTGGGRIDIAWTVASAAGGQTLDWCWTETGVSSVDRAAAPGFGRDLIERAVPYQLGGTSSFEIAADGIRCRVRVPLTEAVGKARPAGGFAPARVGGGAKPD